MQFEFLSIVKSENIKIKIKIYYQLLKIIFKCKLQFDYCNILINNDYSFRNIRCCRQNHVMCKILLLSLSFYYNRF